MTRRLPISRGDPAQARVRHPLSNLGTILCDFKHDFDGAIEVFRKAIELEPRDAKLHYNLGTP